VDRHVIKGRGKNRGKYLCYARMAGLPPDSGYVWLSEQRKAARWEDPQYGLSKYGSVIAREHNGYFVKLVAPVVVQERVDELRTFIADHAVGAEEGARCYWFDNDFHDAGEDFCRECAEKVVDEKYAADPKHFEYLYGKCEDAKERYRAAIDGGSDIDHDSPPYCETCGVKLSGYLTEHGADQEIEAYTTEYAPTLDDVEGWAALEHAIVNLDSNDPRWRKIIRMVDAAQRNSAAPMSAEEALT
jgi:hypothetical protein